MTAALRDVWEGIRGEPARYALAFAAVAVGTASLAVLLSVLDGLEERAERIARDFGANAFAVEGGPGEGKAHPLSEHHAALLAASLDGCVVSTVRRWRAEDRADARLVIGTDENLARVKGWRVVAGRFLDGRDLALRERHAVVTAGASAREALAPGGEITLGGVPFEIVGVVESGDGVPAGAGDRGGARAVFVPGTLPPPAPGGAAPSRAVDAILVQVPHARDLAATLARAERLLAGAGAPASRLAWTTPETLVRGTRRIQDAIRLTAGTVSALCLLLGGVTLMSLMVSNVRERTAEIGLRRAIGASPRDIASLFVLEGCLVTGAASALAVVAVRVALALAGRGLPLPSSPGLRPVALPLVVAVLLGAAFSYGPARTAARVQPSAALRND